MGSIVSPFEASYQNVTPPNPVLQMVRAERTLNGKTSSEARFSISRLAGNARTFGRTVRGHWGIEHAA
ncbi:MAG: hypothetical protein MI924_29600, partial [Chloroflexales bacterium]|nr:hypothetical protein [Chloroflexales bacterium]